MYEILSGEPWCWTQEEINRHTDAYLWNVIIRPAMRKTRKMERQRKGGRNPGERSRRKLPSREGYILIGERLGVPRERSEQEYDKFVADRRAKRGQRG